MIGTRQLSLRTFLCPSPFIWVFFASWLASWASCAATAIEAPEPEVAHLRAGGGRRQNAIYKYYISSLSSGASDLAPKAPIDLEIASTEPIPEQAAEQEARDQGIWPAVVMCALFGVGSILFRFCWMCKRLGCCKSGTIPLHGYASVPRSEVIGHESVVHGAALTLAHQPVDQIGEPVPTQFFYIGDESAVEESQAVSGYNSESLPTESEPEAELCPDAPTSGADQSDQAQAVVELPRLPQPMFQPVAAQMLPELYVQPDEATCSAKDNSRCRLLMLYASPLCRIDSRGPSPLPSLGFEKEWKTVLKASAEAQSGPSTFAARPLTSGPPGPVALFLYSKRKCGQCGSLWFY